MTPRTSAARPQTEWQRLSLNDIAQRIDCHLRRFEADPALNVKRNGLSRFYKAGAGFRGRWVTVVYVLYQGSCALSKADAIAYLAWLDAGNVGQHYAAMRQLGDRT